MSKFRVLLNGTHFWIDADGDGTLTPHGWYTTRWVEAPSPSEARGLAFQRIRDEESIRHLIVNEGKPKPHVRVDEVEEVPAFPSGRTLKPGLAFYPESDSEGEAGARELTLHDRVSR